MQTQQNGKEHHRHLAKDVYYSKKDMKKMAGSNSASKLEMQSPKDELLHTQGVSSISSNGTGEQQITTSSYDDAKTRQISLAVQLSDSQAKLEKRVLQPSSLHPQHDEGDLFQDNLISQKQYLKRHNFTQPMTKSQPSFITPSQNGKLNSIKMTTKGWHNGAQVIYQQEIHMPDDDTGDSEKDQECTQNNDTDTSISLQNTIAAKPENNGKNINTTVKELAKSNQKGKDKQEQESDIRIDERTQLLQSEEDEITQEIIDSREDKQPAFLRVIKKPVDTLKLSKRQKHQKALQIRQALKEQLNVNCWRMLGNDAAKLYGQTIIGKDGGITDPTDSYHVLMKEFGIDLTGNEGLSSAFVQKNGEAEHVELNSFTELFSVRDLLGYGGYGVVLMVKNRKTREKSALKIINKARFSYQAQKILKNESTIMQTMKHPNIVSLKRIYENQQFIMIEMELILGGQLSDLMAVRDEKGQPQPVSDLQASKIMKSLLEGVAYVHAQDIVHRDLKPQNILLANSDSKVKIVDFGVSAEQNYGKRQKKIAGTPIYMAPEQITEKNYSKKVDLWACGIIAYQLLACGQHPLYEPGQLDYCKKLAEIEAKPIDWQFPPNFTSLAKDFFENLCIYPPTKRYDAATALKHPWITRRAGDKIPLTNQQTMAMFEHERQLRKFMRLVYFASHVKMMDSHAVIDQKELVQEQEEEEDCVIQSDECSTNQINEKKQQQQVSNTDTSELIEPYSHNAFLAPQSFAAYKALLKEASNNSQQNSSTSDSKHQESHEQSGSKYAKEVAGMQAQKKASLTNTRCSPQSIQKYTAQPCDSAVGRYRKISRIQRKKTTDSVNTNTLSSPRPCINIQNNSLSLEQTSINADENDPASLMGEKYLKSGKLAANGRHGRNLITIRSPQKSHTQSSIDQSTGIKLVVSKSVSRKNKVRRRFGKASYSRSSLGNPDPIFSTRGLDSQIDKSIFNDARYSAVLNDSVPSSAKERDQIRDQNKHQFVVQEQSQQLDSQFLPMRKAEDGTVAFQSQPSQKDGFQTHLLSSSNMQKIETNQKVTSFRGKIKLSNFKSPHLERKQINKNEYGALGITKQASSVPNQLKTTDSIDYASHGSGNRKKPSIDWLQMIQAEKTVKGSKMLKQHLNRDSPIQETLDESRRSSLQVSMTSQDYFQRLQQQQQQVYHAGVPNAGYGQSRKKFSSTRGSKHNLITLNKSSLQKKHHPSQPNIEISNSQLQAFCKQNMMIPAKDISKKIGPGFITFKTQLSQYQIQPTTNNATQHTFYKQVSGEVSGVQTGKMTPGAQPQIRKQKYKLQSTLGDELNSIFKRKASSSYKLRSNEEAAFEPAPKIEDDLRELSMIGFCTSSKPQRTPYRIAVKTQPQLQSQRKKIVYSASSAAIPLMTNDGCIKQNGSAKISRSKINIISGTGTPIEAAPMYLKNQHARVQILAQIDATSQGQQNRLFKCNNRSMNKINQKINWNRTIIKSSRQATSATTKDYQLKYNQRSSARLMKSERKKTQLPYEKLEYSRKADSFAIQGVQVAVASDKQAARFLNINGHDDKVILR